MNQTDLQFNKLYWYEDGGIIYEISKCLFKGKSSKDVLK